MRACEKECVLIMEGKRGKEEEGEKRASCVKGLVALGKKRETERRPR